MILSPAISLSCFVLSLLSTSSVLAYSDKSTLPVALMILSCIVILSPGINWFCFKSKLLYIAPEVTSLLEFLVTSSSIFIGVISPFSLKYTGVVSDPTDLGVTTLPWIWWSSMCKLTSQAVSLLSLRVISPVC